MRSPPFEPILKAYVDTAEGQVHVRTIGDDDGTTLLLLHWTPASGRMWEAVAPLFARAGYRVIMPDLLGYGRSDRRPQDWSMARWAASVIAVLDALGIKRCDAVGGHNGASVAVEIALAAPERVRSLILDGCAILTPDLRDAFARLLATARPGATDPGVDKLAWNRTVAVLQEYQPGFVVDDRTIEQVWPLMGDYLATDFVSSAPVAAAYDLTARLPLVRVPMLLMSATTDPLYEGTLRAMRLRPDAGTHIFEGHHPIHERARGMEFVKPVLDFVGRPR